MAARADYTHKIEEKCGRKVIVIEDLALGKVSVTNDIDHVLADISKVEKIDPRDHMVVYMDTDGAWDGYDQERDAYVFLAEDSWENAVSKYAQLQLNQSINKANEAPAFSIPWL